MKSSRKVLKLAMLISLLVVGMVLTGPIFGQVQEAWSVPVPGDLRTNNWKLVISSESVCVSWYDEYIIWDGRILDCATMKLAANDGHQLWSAPVCAYGVKSGLPVDSAGNVCVMGYDESTGQWATMKLAANDGHQLWSAPGQKYELAVDSAGNVCVMGYDESTGQWATMKLAANDGHILWSAQVAGRIAVDRAGNVCVMGEGFTVKLAAEDGHQVWSALAGDADSSLAIDAAGNVYVNGYDQITMQYATVKLAADTGVPLWVTPAGGWDAESAIDNAGNVFVSGFHYSIGAWVAIKLAADTGHQLWSAPIPIGCTGYPLVVDSMGNIYFGGYATTVKLAGNDGSQLWSVPGSGWMTCLAVDSAGGVYIREHNLLKKYLQCGEDSTPPTITASAGMLVVSDPGSCIATGVQLSRPTATDNCEVKSLVNDHPSTTFPLGETVVTWTATDFSGNPSTAMQTVVVLGSVGVNLLPPLSGQPVANKIRHGQVVPHKVELVNCSGMPVVSGVTVTLKVHGFDAATSTVFQDVLEDANGIGNDGTVTSDAIMQLVDGRYQFNLDTSNFVDPNTLGSTRYYRSIIIVMDNATLKDLGTAEIILETRK